MWESDHKGGSVSTKELMLFFFNLNFIYFFTLQYCIGFAIHWHESAMGVHVFLILNPPPTSLPSHPSGSSQCTSSKHPVSCIEPGLAIHFTYDNIHVSMPFSQIIPPLPSPTESETQMFIYPIYNSLHLLIPTSQSIPTLPYPPPLSNHKSVLYVCESVSVS